MKVEFEWLPVRGFQIGFCWWTSQAFREKVLEVELGVCCVSFVKKITGVANNADVN